MNYKTLFAAAALALGSCKYASREQRPEPFPTVVAAPDDDTPAILWGITLDEMTEQEMRDVRDNCRKKDHKSNLYEAVRSSLYRRH